MMKSSLCKGAIDGVAGRLESSTAASRSNDRIQVIEVLSGHAPQPILILHLAEGKIVEMLELPKTPDWAKPLVAAAIKVS